MSFQYTVSLNDPTGSSLDSVVIASANAALAKYSQYITGLGTIDVQINVRTARSSSTGFYANGGWTTSTPIGTDGGHTVFEGGAANELRTGKDLNGAQPDIQITLDPNLQDAQFDPNGSPSTSQIDGFGLLQHEISHGLGFGGYRDPTTGNLGTAESPWDKNISIASDGTAYFVGATAQAIYGGPVPVTTLQNGEQYSHLSNSFSDRAAYDLMTGLFYQGNRKYAISDLDLAVLKDMGLTITGKVGDYPTEPAKVAGLNPIYRFYDTVTSDHFYTGDLGERASIQNNLKSLTFEGVVWETPTQGAGTTDVFRFFDTVTKNHFLTSSVAERDTILKTLPTFTYEGVAFEAYTNAGADGTFALERFFNTNSKVHTYAADANEIALIKSGAVGQGWVDEGASFIVHHPVGDILLA